ncbi:PorV/PorQ family protein [Candidatus Poribacteria bacterium]|nr:PorV/PorQ family protein [Candidatus Poribacteria bacterium]
MYKIKTQIFTERLCSLRSPTASPYGKVMKIRTIGCLFVLLATFVPSAVGAEIHEEAGTTGAAFLKIEAGSRPASMGGAFAGLADDANAVFYNPAGLTSIVDRELTAMQNFWFAGINNESISYVQRLGDGAFGLSFLGAFAKIDERAEPTEDPIRTFTASSFAVGLSYGHELIKNVSLGGTIKFLSQQFDIEDWTGVAGDVGVLLGSNRLRVGASIQNLGTLRSKIEEESLDESLPLNIRVGGAFHLIVSEPSAAKEPVARNEANSTQTGETKPSVDEANTLEKQESPSEPIIQSEPEPILTIVADVNIPKSGYPVVHLGLENWFHDILALRVGYSFSQGDNTNRGITAGLGLRAWGTAPLENINFQFDYAFAPNREVGDTHRISFISRF